MGILRVNYLGGEEKAVFVRTRKASGGNNLFYVHEVFTEDEIKSAIRERGTLEPDQAQFQGPRDFYKSLIARYLEVKGEAAQPGKEAGQAQESPEDSYRSELPLVATVESGVIRKSNGVSAIQAAINLIERNVDSPVRTEIGEVILDGKGIIKSLHHSMYPAKLDAVQAIQDVLERGAYLAERGDKDHKPIDNHY